jgi:tripartite-type tricarboxylate transporter receptor subunit TctC
LCVFRTAAARNCDGPTIPHCWIANGGSRVERQADQRTNRLAQEETIVINVYLRQLFRAASLALLAAIAWQTPLQAQDKYPTKPIDIIVPFAPGGATDVSMRILGAYMTKKWGVAVNVINKPGARGIPQTLELYRAAPDGYTLLGDNPTTNSMLAASMGKDLPFDPFERTFLGMNTGSAFTVIVAVATPYQTLQQLMEDVKKTPEKISYPSQGSTGMPDYFIRTLFDKAGVDIARAPGVMVTSGSQSVTLTAGGNVIMGLATASTAIGAWKSGLVRILTISSKERDPEFPNVPSTVELGYPEVISWNGLSAPPKTPKHIVDAYDKLFQESVKDPEYVQTVIKSGAVPFYYGPEATKEYVRKEIESAKRLMAAK